MRKVMMAGGMGGHYGVDVWDAESGDVLHEDTNKIGGPYVLAAEAEAEIERRCLIAEANAEAALASRDAEIEVMRARKDAAYLERNQVVAALAKCFPSGIARTSIEGWSDDWHGCVYIDLPTGQVSWHYHDSHAHLFADLPPYRGAWDGHDTPEKYRRLAAVDRDAEIERLKSLVEKRERERDNALSYKQAWENRAKDLHGLLAAIDEVAK